MTRRDARRRWAALALVIITVSAMCGAMWASDKDETVVTVQVSSADHELMEGYFTLGENLTVMAKPGSEVHRFLARHRGKKIRVSLVDAATPVPARLQR